MVYSKSNFSIGQGVIHVGRSDSQSYYAGIIIHLDEQGVSVIAFDKKSEDCGPDETRIKNIPIDYDQIVSCDLVEIAFK